MSSEYSSVFAAEMQDHIVLLNDAGWYTAKAKCYLRSFDRFMREQGVSVKSIEEGIVTKWLASKPVKAETKRNMFSELNRFAKYLLSLGFPVHMPDAPRPATFYVPYIFTKEEFEQIIYAADMWQGHERITKATHIFPVLLRLLYCCGLRLGEGLKLTWDDVDLETGIITIRTAKNMKQRFVPVSESMCEILTKYQKMTRAGGICTEYLFETEPRFGESTPYSNLTFQTWFANILRAAGIVYEKESPNDRGPCPHCLRHMFVFDSFTKSENEGRSFEETAPYLSAYLGHETLAALEIYLSKNYALYKNSHKRVDDYISNVFPEVSFQ